MKSWALLCAKLGRKSNMKEFFQAFGTAFINDVLNQVSHTPDWQQARRSFQSALRREEDIRHARKSEYERQNHRIRNEINIDATEELIQRRRSELSDMKTRKHHLQSELARISYEITQMKSQDAALRQKSMSMYWEVQGSIADYEQTLTMKPSWFHIFQHHEWKQRLQEKNQRLFLKQQEYEYYWHASQQCNEAEIKPREEYQSQLSQRLWEVNTSIDSLSNELGKLETQFHAMRITLDRRIGDLLSQEGSPFKAPYIDREWNEARTRVFLEALALHQALIEANHKQIWTNLNNLCKHVDNRNGTTNADMLMQIWRTFFLVVPVVSTTFASVSRMFGSLNNGVRDSDAQRFGLALIDEAGQAQPQFAAGLLQRVRYCVAVGDPAQLEPVDTVPPQVRRLLAHTFQIRIGRESSNVQECMDYQTPWGQMTNTTGSDEDRQWIGIPLIVHRRCHKPMFDICNDMAYEGRMRSAVPESAASGSNASPASRLPASHWYDVTDDSLSPESAGATDSGTKDQWRQAEGDQLRKLLSKLLASGIGPQDILVISPFRAVARQINDIYKKVLEQLTGAESVDELADSHSGTVHISQGREADIVILVLGSQPGNAGAGSRRWVNSKPNLLNVAVSRAKRRLYVIGNFKDWTADERMRYSRQLGDRLHRWSQNHSQDQPQNHSDNC